MDRFVSFAQLFYRHAQLHPDHPALFVDEQIVSYGELKDAAQELAAYLKQQGIQRLGILASRSLQAYVGILAAHWVGAAFIPLNPAFPILRLNKIIASAELDGLLVDEIRLPLLDKLDCKSLCVITPEFSASTTQTLEPVQIAPEALAYLMFTSGSTGSPKGVPISFKNLSYFTNVLAGRYSLNPQDRIAQFSNLSFDACILDMGLVWLNGATLYVIPEHLLLGPAEFLREHAITFWFIVPSVVAIMHKLNMLQAGNFPALKHSLFAGEALTLQHAELWQQAAPNCLIENFYGPTEITVDCLAHCFTKTTEAECHLGIVPIGKPFPNIYAAIINDRQEFLASGEKGELVIAGEQIASGYWQAPHLTAEKFRRLRHPEWGEKIWYLTGDYCYQDNAGIFHYLRRLDNQHKILGQRVELEEIECYLREITGCTEVIAIVTGSKEQLDLEIVAAIGKTNLSIASIMQQLKGCLPAYMVPSHIIQLPDFPYNINGKLDRKLLTEVLLKKLMISI